MILVADALMLSAIILATIVGVSKYRLKKQLFRLKNAPQQSVQRRVAETVEPLVYQRLNGLTRLDLALLVTSGALGAASKAINIVTHFLGA